MPLPVPNPSESQQDFISRFIETVSKEDASKPHKQVTAMAFSQWEEAHKHDKKFAVESFDSALIFALDGLKPRVKIQPPAGMPWDINGQTCGYFKSEVLPIRQLVDTKGKLHEITDSRADELLANFKLAQSLGYKPHIPPRHEDAGDGSKNLGFVIDAMKENGSVYQIEQFIGDDAIKCASRNGTSIGTMMQTVLHNGQAVNEFWDHSACVPNGQLGTSNECSLAASRSKVVPLCLQFSRSGDNEMTDEIFNKAKLCFGRDIPSDLTKDNAIEKLIALKTPAKAEISDADFEQLKLAFGREVPSDLSKQNAIGKLSEHTKTLVKATPKKQPDASTLYLARQLLDAKRSERMNNGDITKAMADTFEKSLVGTDVTALTLSRSSTEADQAIFEGINKCIELYDSLKDAGAGLRMSKVKVADDNLADEKKLTDDEKERFLSMAGYAKSK